MSERRWAVVIPVKPAAAGKSRLVLEGSAVDRVALARAIALDTIAAAAECEAVAEVVVVTDDESIADAAAAMSRVRVVAEGESRGLTAAIATGMATLDDRMPRAALLGDLPALRPSDLAAALQAAGAHSRAVVADADGTGSTLVTAGHAVQWMSAFGEDSLARHVALGSAVLPVDPKSGLRRDVDTSADLAAAATLGFGPHTARSLASP